MECEDHCYKTSIPDFHAYQYQEEDEMQRELRKQRDLLDQDSSVRNVPSPSGSSPSPGPGISYIQSNEKGEPTVVYVTRYCNVIFPKGILNDPQNLQNLWNIFVKRGNLNLPPHV